MWKLLLGASDAPTALIVEVGHDRAINFVSAHLARSAWVAVQARSPQEAAALEVLGFGLNNGHMFSRQAEGFGVDGLSAEVARIALAVARMVWHEADDAMVRMRIDLVRTT
jgi:hypothetical protein